MNIRHGPTRSQNPGQPIDHLCRGDQRRWCQGGIAGSNFQPPFTVISDERVKYGLLRWIIPIMLAAFTAGCALVTATPPEVEVAAVELRGLGVLDQALGVTLCVSNPNDAELSFRRVMVALEVAGAPLAESASEVPVRLPPRSSVLVPFTVATTVRNLGPQLLDVVRTGGVDYRVRGRVQLDGALPITVPFSRGGRLDLLAAGARLLIPSS